MAVKAKKTKAPVPTAGQKPRADINGWVLCPGDNVLIVSPGEEYHGLFAKVDAFPTTLELSSYVQIDGRPSTSGRVLLPNAQLRWMGPDEERIELFRPTRPGQQVRVVLENEALATPEMKGLEGKLGTVTELSPTTNDLSMVTVKFDDPELAQWPTSINSYDLLVVPIPVVQYVPEPEAEHPAIQEESDLPFLNDQAQPSEPIALAAKPAPKASALNLAMVGDMVNAQKAGLRMVPLASIVVTTNTRKVFDEASLAELAESIKNTGLLQNLVVRPYAAEPGKYELVAGGRRYKACQMAGLTEVAALVRELTDREFMEAQLLENLQRVDVRPADEAEAFSKLLKNGFALEEIAAKVGKPARFVAERARLMELAPEWVDALQQGRLLIGSAHLLARLTPNQQAESHKLLTRTYGELIDVAGTMLPVYTAAEIRQHIDRLYRAYDLDAVAFPKDDADLFRAAGPCTTCPKRSGNTLYLFDEMGGNKCLDGGCFAEKSARYVAQVAERLGADGQPVLKVANHWGRVPADVLNLNKHQSTEGFKEKELTGLREAGRVRPALMTEGPSAGQVVEVILPAAVASQPDVVAAIKEEKLKQTEKEKQEAAKVRALGAARRQAHYQLSTDVRGEGLYTAIVLRRVLYTKLQYHSYGSLRKMLQEVYGWGELKGGSYLNEDERARVQGYLAAMDVQQLQALLLDIQLLNWVEEEHPSTLPALCKELGWSDEQLLAAHAERKKSKKQEVVA